MVYFKHQIFNPICPNAAPVAALRALADFIFAFRFHFISHHQLSLPTNPLPTGRQAH